MNAQRMNDVSMHHHCHVKCMSWTALIVGALVGIGLSFLLNLFSVAIGLSAFTLSQDGLVTLAIGGFIGLLIGGIVSMFVAGFTAGYLGRPYCAKRNLGVVYGFGTWCLMLILSVFLTAPLGRFVSNYTAAVANNQKVTEIIVTKMPNNEAGVQASTHNGATQVAVDPEKAANSMGMAAFIIFVIFFIGALACCFGGHAGMVCCKDRDDHC